MKKSKFIFIGIILIVIILGFFILKNNNQKICGFEEIGDEYSSKYCNKSCQLDEDCKYYCGCGAINVNETCDTGEFLFDCDYIEPKCENNICIQ
ncbi:MAG: hypothetical protein PF542_06090 [Nanoarchaeota archaeon]|jgi:hypothetical protein|nr:hypothetical protein [Nanoarchaeota archaeon]